MTLEKIEQKCKNAKINTHQICYMPNPLNFVTLNNSHLKVQQQMFSVKRSFVTMLHLVEVFSVLLAQIIIIG